MYFVLYDMESIGVYTLELSKLDDWLNTQTLTNYQLTSFVAVYKYCQEW